MRIAFSSSYETVDCILKLQLLLAVDGLSFDPLNTGSGFLHRANRISLPHYTLCLVSMRTCYNLMNDLNSESFCNDYYDSEKFE